MSAGPRRSVPLAFDAALALALGAIFTVGFVHTQAWALQLPCIGLLVWRAGVATPARAGGLGWLFGTGWLVAGTWWLFISMHRYGGLNAGAAALAVLLLAAALSAYLGLATWAWARWRPGRPLIDALLFALAWLAAELARARLFTGFPWVASGYGQVDGPLAALAPWVGVYGMGAVLAFVAAWIALALTVRAARPWSRILQGVAALALLAAAPWAQRDFSAPTGRLPVSLVQTNVAQDEKFALDRMPAALDWLARSLHGARAQLVVAPETAIPLLPDQLGDPAWRDIAAPFAAPGRFALLGLPLGSYEAGYTNSVAGLSAQHPPDRFYRYDKHHLVPFGEFIPWGFRWFVDAMSIPLGDFARGPLVAPSFPVLGERVAPNICYEDLFGEELAARFTDPAQAPTVMANVSNIAWFGDTIAIAQHLHISRLRTLELQRPMLRATNTGATAVIDHRGQVRAALPPFTQGVLEGEVEGRSGVTPYAHWAGRFGLWPPTLLCLAGLGVAALAAGRRRRLAARLRG